LLYRVLISALCRRCCQKEWRSHVRDIAISPTSQGFPVADALAQVGSRHCAGCCCAVVHHFPILDLGLTSFANPPTQPSKQYRQFSMLSKATHHSGVIVLYTLTQDQYNTHAAHLLSASLNNDQNKCVLLTRDMAGFD
jgi:hypothetical protein